MAERFEAPISTSLDDIKVGNCDAEKDLKDSECSIFTPIGSEDCNSSVKPIKINYPDFSIASGDFQPPDSTEKLIEDQNAPMSVPIDDVTACKTEEVTDNSHLLDIKLEDHEKLDVGLVSDNPCQETADTESVMDSLGFELSKVDIFQASGEDVLKTSEKPNGTGMNLVELEKSDGSSQVNVPRESDMKIVSVPTDNTDSIDTFIMPSIESCEQKSVSEADLPEAAKIGLEFELEQDMAVKEELVLPIDVQKPVEADVLDSKVPSPDLDENSSLTSQVGTILIHETISGQNEADANQKEEFEVKPLDNGQTAACPLNLGNTSEPDKDSEVANDNCETLPNTNLKNYVKTLKTKPRSEVCGNISDKQSIIKARKNKILSIIANNEPKSKSLHKYTSAELKILRDSPLSKTKPGCLDDSYFKPTGVWDPIAFFNKKPGNYSPIDNAGPKQRRKNDKDKKNLDPKTRIKEELDGIVLSPQRRSFFFGCNINVGGSKTQSEHCDRGLLERDSHRDLSNRRIGSGRIVRERDSDKEKDYGYGRKDRKERLDKDDRFDKRSSVRDKAGDGKYQRRRSKDDPKPEWFSGGPTSQHDTIELRGFEDEHFDGDFRKNHHHKVPDHSFKDESLVKPTDPSGIQAMLQDLKTSKSPSNDQKDKLMDFNDFFKSDSVPGVLPSSHDSEVQESRFRQWFKSCSPTNDCIGELHSNVGSGEDSGKSVNIFEMLDKAGKEANFNKLFLSGNGTSIRDLAVQGKLKSVQELEADMKLTQPVDKSSEPSAFNKLLAQMSDNKPPMPYPNLSDKSRGRVSRDQGGYLMRQTEGSTMLMGQSGEDQKTQMSQMNKVTHPVGHKPINSGSPLPPDLQIIINQTSLSADLLQRTEAQAIITGLANGQFTRQHILHQLQNSGLQQRTRDILLNILKLQQHGLPPSIFQRSSTPPNLVPTSGSPVPDPGLFQPNRTPSPLGMQRRVPSPKELAVHTQQIYQNALLKRKLVEQNENYRKRQEMQMGCSAQVSMPLRGGGDGSPVKSPNLLAFTPTSVMRKRVAEKDKLGSRGESLKEAGDAVYPIGRSNGEKVPSPDLYLQSKMSGDNIFRTVNGVPNTSANIKDQLLKGFPRNVGQVNPVLPRNYDPPRADANNVHQRSLLGSYNRHGLSNMGIAPNLGIRPPIINPMNISNSVLDLRLPLNVGQAVRPVNPPVPSLSGQPPLSLLTSYNDIQRRQADQRQLKYGSPNIFKNNRPPTSLLEQNYRQSHPHLVNSRGVHGLNRPMTTGSSKGSPQNHLALLFGDNLLNQSRNSKFQNLPPVPTQKALSLEEVERLQQAQVVRN